MTIQDLKHSFPFPPEPPNVPLSDHGWFGPEHEELLSGALSVTTKVVLELGSWLGKSTRFIATRAPNATVLAVDHWKGLPDNPWNGEWKQFLPTLYETFIKNCWHLKDRIIPLRIETQAGMKIVHERGVVPDLIFIDASHEYKDVNADIALALNLFPGTVMCGDDYLWPGVGQAVREHVASGVMKVFVKKNVWWKESPSFAHMDGVKV